jgi:putative two-component system response regulator
MTRDGMTKTMSLDRQILQANILIIDDENLSIRILSQILQKGGFRHIHSLTDPRQAVEYYQKLQPDCVVLDINMPHMNGFQVLEELKKVNGDNYLPVIVISGEGDPGVKFATLESGAKDFLNKPYDRVEVLLRIRNLIEVRLLNNQIANQNKDLEVKVRERTK